jgi:hypothetical protein
LRWVYESARIDDDDADDLGTGLGLVVANAGRAGGSQELVVVGCRGDSESDALSQASSSPHSAAVSDRFMPMCGRAGGGRAAIVADR